MRVAVVVVPGFLVLVSCARSGDALKCRLEIVIGQAGLEFSCRNAGRGPDVEDRGRTIRHARSAHGPGHFIRNIDHVAIAPRLDSKFLSLYHARIIGITDVLGKLLLIPPTN